MKRSRFLAALLVFMAAYSSFAQRAKPLYQAQLGVQAYTFRHQFPKGALATLDTIKALGFTEMEAGTPKGMTPEEFRKACDERGIKIPGTGVGYEQMLKTPEEVVRSAKILGAKYVMCAWIPHQKGNFTLENAKKAVEDFNAFGKILKENGLTFCYHNHGYEFQPYGDGTLMDYIIQQTNPAYVSFEMDILWAIHGGADPVALLKKYGKRWKLMHIKDLKKGIKGDLTGNTPAENDVVVGEGQADMVGILKEANRLGIKHFFIEDESNQEMKQVPKSIAYLKSLRQ
jgi:sugar phosphate isomerase/epimerase